LGERSQSGETPFKVAALREWAEERAVPAD
jgi:hypothetical protein